MAILKKKRKWWMIMAHKLKLSPYMLVTIASICLMSGLYVLTGGDDKHDTISIGYVND